MSDIALDAPRPDGRRWWGVLGVVGLMFSLPFLAPFKAPPVPSFHAEMVAAALGLLALCLTWGFRRGSSLPLPWTLALPGLLCLILIGQVLARQVPAQQSAFLAMLYLLWAAGLVVVGATLRQGLGLARSATGLAWFLVAGGALSALAGVAQLLGFTPITAWVMPTNGGVWGNLGQPNHFANYLAMALASVLMLWSAGKLGTLAALVLAALMCWMLPMSGSRSIWLYAGSFVGIAALWYWRDRSRVQARLLLATVCVLAAMLVAEWVWHLLGAEGLAHVTSLDRVKEIGTGERPHLWTLAWRMITQSPWSGVGYGQFGWHYFLLNGLDPRPLEGYAHHAHNVVLQLGAELGMAGLLALGAGVVLWGLAVRRLACTPASWWLLCLCAILGIHALLEYPLWYTYFLGIAAIVLGLCEGGKLEFKPTRLLRGLLTVCLVLSWFVLGQLFRDYVYLENFLAFRYRFIDATPEVSARAKEMLLDIRRTSLLAPYVELGLARAIDITPAQLDAKIRVNGHAMRQFPIDDVVYRQAMLLALQGQEEAALRQWDWARASYPDLEPMALAVLRRRAQDLSAELSTLLKHAEANHRR